MSANTQEMQKREAVARSAIKSAFNLADQDSEVTLFIAHHLEALDSAYWQRHFSTANPDPQSILDCLVVQSYWGTDNELEAFDFTLPEDVTNYLISVSFNDAGEVADIKMES